MRFKDIHAKIATAIRVGYILLIRRLYQSGNCFKPPIGFRKSVKPEQKKNNTSPIQPPVARKLYFPYNKLICELVIRRAAKHFRMSILTLRSFIVKHIIPPFIYQYIGSLHLY